MAPDKRLVRRSWVGGESAPPLRAVPERANDVGVRCALRRLGSAHRDRRATAGAATSCAGAGMPARAARAAQAVTGATPQSEGLVRVRGRVCFHTLAPAPWVAPAPSIPAGRPSARRCGTRRINGSASGSRRRSNGSRRSPARANGESLAAATHRDLGLNIAIRISGDNRHRQLRVAIKTVPKTSRRRWSMTRKSPSASLLPQVGPKEVTESCAPGNRSITVAHMPNRPEDSRGGESYMTGRGMADEIRVNPGGTA